MRKIYIKPQTETVAMMKFAPLIMASRDVLQGSYNGNGKYSSMGFGGETGDDSYLYSRESDSYWDDDDNE